MKTLANKKKTPSQERSRITVQRIKEGALALLADHGHQSISTNMIAQQANISIGSIYQYFPNKEAIFKEIAMDHVDTMDRKAAEMIRANADASPRDIALQIFNQLFEMLHAISDDESAIFWATFSDPDLSDDLMERVNQTIHYYLLYNRQRFGLKNVELTARVLSTAILSTLKEYFLHPEQFPGLHELVDELALLAGGRLGAA